MTGVQTCALPIFPIEKDAVPDEMSPRDLFNKLDELKVLETEQKDSAE